MVNTPLTLAEALARFIAEESLDRDVLITAEIYPYADDYDYERGGHHEVGLHVHQLERGRELAAKYRLVDDAVLYPPEAPTTVHHSFKGTWQGIRVRVNTIEPLTEPATDPGDDLAALGDEGDEPA